MTFGAGIVRLAAARSRSTLPPVRRALIRPSLTSPRGLTLARRGFYRHPQIESVMGRVLIVDDQAESASTLAAVILMMGHEVRFGTTCDEALEIAEEFQPEVAFVDLLMPKVDGFECANRLQKHDSALRLIAMSGYSVETWQYKPEVFEKYLLKPVRSQTILDLIGGKPGARL